MALKVTRLEHTWEYILKDDRKSKNPTVFTLRRLSYYETATVAPKTPLADAPSREDLMLSAAQLVRLGLVKVSGLVGQDGETLPDMTGDEFVPLAHVDVIDELSMEIAKAGLPSVETRKN
jgi:hypothetical protein